MKKNSFLATFQEELLNPKALLGGAVVLTLALMLGALVKNFRTPKGQLNTSRFSYEMQAPETDDLKAKALPKPLQSTPRFKNAPIKEPKIALSPLAKKTPAVDPKQSDDSLGELAKKAEKDFANKKTANKKDNKSDKNKKNKKKDTDKKLAIRDKKSFRDSQWNTKKSDHREEGNSGETRVISVSPAINPQEEPKEVIDKEELVKNFRDSLLRKPKKETMNQLVQAYLSKEVTDRDFYNILADLLESNSDDHQRVAVYGLSATPGLNSYTQLAGSLKFLRGRQLIFATEVVKSYGSLKNLKILEASLFSGNPNVVVTSLNLIDEILLNQEKQNLVKEEQEVLDNPNEVVKSFDRIKPESVKRLLTILEDLSKKSAPIVSQGAENTMLRLLALTT